MTPIQDLYTFKNAIFIARASRLKPGNERLRRIVSHIKTLKAPMSAEGYELAISIQALLKVDENQGLLKDNPPYTFTDTAKALTLMIWDAQANAPLDPSPLASIAKAFSYAQEMWRTANEDIRIVGKLLNDCADGDPEIERYNHILQSALGDLIFDTPNGKVLVASDEMESTFEFIKDPITGLWGMNTKFGFVMGMVHGEV